MKLRMTLVLVFVTLWSAGIVARLAALQVGEHDAYRARAERQQLQVAELEPPRGAIRDAAGRELALSVRVDSAWADPARLRAAGADPAAVVRAVSGVVDVDRTKLARELDSERSFVWVDRQLDRPQASALEELALPGVGFVKEYKRYYPMGELAAQVLGFAGIDQQGLAGLELVYDDRVAGHEGRRILLRDARRGTAATPVLAGSDARPGATLRLTLDAAVQHTVERELARAVADSGATGGSVVMLDPRDGAVMAMASWPPLDANRYPGPPRASRNRPVMDSYEPGSTFKMVTAAAALAANRLDPGDELDCEMGGITLAGVRIRDHKAFGVLSLRQVIARSSNVGAIKTGLAVGDRGLYDAVEAFGFGRPTGIDLPAENPGEVRPFEAWLRQPLTKAYVSFGQGISVTPLQLTRAFAAVANGGELLRPYVVAAVEGGEDGGEGAVRTARRVDGRPLSALTAREVERMLEGVVEEGTGKAAAVPGYRVAGKTGTAQKAVPGGGYSQRKFVASFVGFVPARRPRLVMAVILDEPWPRYHGGEVAAPVFARIAEEVLLYLGVAPDGPSLAREVT